MKIILVMMLTCLFLKADAQKSLLDSIIHIFQTQSIYKDNVNWDSIRPQLYESIDHLESDSVKAMIPAYIRLSKILNITHGGLNYEGKSYGAINKGLVDMFKRISNNIKTSAQNKKYNFRTAIIGKYYGYISIPSVSIRYSNDMNKVKQMLNKKAGIIQDSLCKLNIPNLKGIILDLRLNGGGSSVAMMGGLISLFEEGKLFSFDMADGKQQKVIKDKEYIIFEQDTLVKLKPTCPRVNKVKLAVLISPYTASAGEQTAISLEGRENTIFIGERTRGMTTGIETISLRKDLTLDCAEGYTVDRNGKIYDNGVFPDIEVIGGDDFKNLKNDKKVQMALKWFKRN